MPDIKETAMPLLANTLIFKSGGIIIYYVLRHYRRNSEVCISPGYYEDMDLIMKKLERMAADK